MASTAAPTPTQRAYLFERREGARVAQCGTSVELGESVVDGQGRVAHRVVGVGSKVEDGAQAADGLPAADPAAAAAPTLGLDDHVAELPGVPVPTAQQSTVGDDPAADPDLAEDHQDVLPGRVAGRRLGDGGQVALVVDGDGVGVPEPLAQEVTHRDVAPPQVRPVGEHVAVAVDQPGHSDGESDRGDATTSEVGVRSPDQLGEVVDDLLGGDGVGVEPELVLAHHRAAEVERQGRDVVDVDLGTEPADQVAVELDSGSGSAHRAALEVTGADQAAIREVRHQARDRRAGETQLGGERGPRPRTLFAEPT